MTQAGLSVRGVRKAYGSTPVLGGIDMDVPHNEFHTLLGPSGSGKTTLLRIVAGFTAVDSGRVTLDGRDITDVLPEHRNIGVVFQNYALFPHMTVAENIGFGLRMRRVAKTERTRRVEQVLALVRMRGFAHRYPSALSGGQQQRVALARALVIEPLLLLLDEPLSALDRKIRGEVREELKRIQAETKVTTVMVTHDQEEALFLADRVLVLDAGTLQQQGDPRTVYHQPANAFVAGFLGPINSLPVQLLARPDGLDIGIGKQRFVAPSALRAAADHAGSARLIVRPEQVAVTLADASTPPPDALAATVSAIEFGGPTVTMHVALEGHDVSVLALSPDIPEDGSWRPGVAVFLRVRQGRLLADTEG